jgi:hypothetical protein
MRELLSVEDALTLSLLLCRKATQNERVKTVFFVVRVFRFLAYVSSGCLSDRLSFVLDDDDACQPDP